jgi:ribosomal protein S18 acetylase RimI-like enzyme
MVRWIEPLESKTDFDNLTKALAEFLDDPESFKYLSYTLVKYDKKFIEEQTRKHKEIGLDYLVYEKDDQLKGILAFKRNPSQGFELFLLVVDRNNQKSGLGQCLLDECLQIASKEKYKCIDSFVFADNKKMLRLLIKNDFRPIAVVHSARSDGMDLVKLRYYA